MQDYTRAMYEHTDMLHEPVGSITSPDDVKPYVYTMTRASVEHVVVIPMDAAGHVLGVEEISKGSCMNSICDIPSLFRHIYGNHAYDTSVSFILAHNHPSGQSNPSPEDIEMTRKVKKASDTMGLPMVDHMIFGRYGESYSIARSYPEIFR